jgi:squamous cell carcinoma antigen recognized by T-cells 3
LTHPFKHGEIFDVRWPSKKYKNTRRFCYVQYTAPVRNPHTLDHKHLSQAFIFLSQAVAASALSLHGYEAAPGRKLTVYISNPERKQERSDASANAREIYVAGLSRSVNEKDLRKLFETVGLQINFCPATTKQTFPQFGSIGSIRLPLDEKGNAKGFAFVEFENTVRFLSYFDCGSCPSSAKESANAALSVNNQELKKRRIAVTLADTRVQSRQRYLPITHLVIHVVKVWLVPGKERWIVRPGAAELCG